MAKLVYAADLKSAVPKGTWGFESPLSHICILNEQTQRHTMRKSSADCQLVFALAKLVVIAFRFNASLDLITRFESQGGANLIFFCTQTNTVRENSISFYIKIQIYLKDMTNQLNYKNKYNCLLGQLIFYMILFLFFTNEIFSTTVCEDSCIFN